MTKTSLMGAVAAIFLVGCGGAESPTAEETSRAESSLLTDSVTCEDIQQVVDHVREGLGDCRPSFENQEPLAFSHAACDAGLATSCDAAGLEDARRYVDCLQAVEACDPARQDLFDESIDACLDRFQNSSATEECIELVIGD
ncbi:hypothetical protein HPC49_38885 [Pyxidicoccus fallax]|uniref:Lipoprotein n=1 Tax=Pyxidicoccus fallax TaxID=394095 RepID=A0A848LHN1_9BACT|nr:hypothetical protein [Pyxidicoccus fallax]NMO16921.1 hypothetical protein [Pyxidicoccus fallax]NPC84165.1 hypothetical protein [Pyxidicoccus fallax]